MSSALDTGTHMADTTDLAIRLRSVVKRYGAITAVNGLDLDVPYGACVGLLGLGDGGAEERRRRLRRDPRDERRGPCTR